MYDEPEPDWFPNEGDRQWWQEKHQIQGPAEAGFRWRLLFNARMLVSELERRDWEGCTVREIIMILQSILDEDE